MTSRATTSSTRIEPLIDAVRSETTIGAPVTVYVAPLRGLNSRHRDGGAHEPDRVRAPRLAQPRLEAHLHERGAPRPGPLGREQVGELALRRARRLRRVEDERRDERRVVQPRDRRQPVARRERQQLGAEALLDGRARLRGAALGGCLRQAAAAGRPARGRGGRVGLELAGRRAALVAGAELAHGGVDERARAEHDLDRAAAARAGRRGRPRRPAASRPRARFRRGSPRAPARARGPG